MDFITKLETIDLSTSTSTCLDWIDYPIGVYEATGGLLGGIPVICGGQSGANVENMCYAIGVGAMSTKRMRAASVALNGERLWISGGFTGSNELSSSEFVNIDGQTTPGPELPFSIQMHIMINIAYNNTLVIGGYSSAFGYLATVHFYNHHYEIWSNAPLLNEARAKTAAGIIVDEVTFEELVVVTGGLDFTNGIKYILMSTEILDGGEWSMGKKILFD